MAPRRRGWVRFAVLAAALFLLGLASARATEAASHERPQSRAAPSLPSAAVQKTSGSPAPSAPSCERPVYLTFDTGHMGVAALVAEVLARHEVKATFFLANERTRSGGGSLDDEWAPWWRARAAEGHAFGSHTWDHEVWKADVAATPSTPRAAEGVRVGPGEPALRVVPTMGPEAGRARTLSAQAYCEALKRPARRFEAMTGQAMGAIFRAPGGRTSPALLKAAADCGFTHVGWSPAGFLGDELPSEQHPNAVLLQRAVREVKPGDILLAHLGIWSRRDPWAPAVLEPLIVGLRGRGLCFATLREHPVLGVAATRRAP